MADEYFKAQVADKIRQADERYAPQATGFLDPHERRLAEEVVREPIAPDVAKVFYGGYEDAERTVLFLMPPYSESVNEAAAEELSVIRVKASSAVRKLRHGDYLGSLMSLGIDRSLTGDILVREDGADIIVKKSIVPFLLTGYDKAANISLTCEEVSLGDLIVPELRREEFSDTVASMRLDSIVSSAFSISRAKAQEAVRAGIVFVNSCECCKIDRIVAEGDKIVMRGRGKVVIVSASGHSRKNRLYVDFERYV
ncbi:MAG: RNA-binding protein [Eubacterium sp.]|jgi:RNA-binding protein YlmH